MIKHISLDAYNTLIVPNPEFSKKRNTYLSLVLGIDFDTIKSTFTEVKTELDEAAAMNQSCGSTPQAFHRLFEKLNIHDQIDISTVMNQVSVIYRENPPELAPGVLEIMSYATDAGFTFSITSNTNFVSGMVVQSVLTDMGVPVLFALFSDLFGMPKPHPAMFAEMFHRAKAIHWHNRRLSSLKKENVIHIGDDERCDYHGAINYGIRAIKVNGIHETTDAIEEAINGNL